VVVLPLGRFRFSPNKIDHRGGGLQRRELAKPSKEVLDVGKLDGKVALITGAGSGIGRATAVLFAREGARVAVADCVPAGGQETVGMIKKAGGEALFIEADVSKAVHVERMVKTTVDTYGRIDILYNHAGINSPIAPIADITEEDWDLVLGTNLKSVFLGTKYVIPVMLEQGGGVIVNTASIMGTGAQVYISPYCVSKAGIILLTKATSAEYAKQNIRVNCICPGFIATPMTEPWLPTIQMDRTPPGRAGLPEHIARAALYLASDDSEYVTGTSLVVDGGYSAEWLLPLKE
jgi:NAD(P)-dependent dehydrogenase (short-subunit alcohol dehydrogenase family)